MNSGDITLGGGEISIVIVVALIAVAALAMGLLFRKEVLATPPGTPNMQAIGQAVQEGAQAYLQRQFKTLSIFVVIAFVLLFALPADDTAVRIGRSVFFVLGATFSAGIGYLGMNLATAANMRVAEAARNGDRDKGMQIAFRTGGTVGMATVGLGLLGASLVVLFYQGNAPQVLEASASAPPFSRCSCESVVASSPRRPTSAPTSSARSRRASPRTTRATRPRSRTTSVTTSATAQGWRPTSSSRMPSRSSRR